MVVVHQELAGRPELLEHELDVHKEHVELPSQLHRRNSTQSQSKVASQLAAAASNLIRYLSPTPALVASGHPALVCCFQANSEQKTSIGMFARLPATDTRWLHTHNMKRRISCGPPRQLETSMIVAILLCRIGISTSAHLAASSIQVGDVEAVTDLVVYGCAALGDILQLRILHSPVRQHHACLLSLGLQPVSHLNTSSRMYLCKMTLAPHGSKHIWQCSCCGLLTVRWLV